MPSSNIPVIIYAPGLGRDAANTGDRIAEVIAGALDRRDAGMRYSTKSDAAISAPRGLRVSKTVVDNEGAPVLQVFELDYRGRLEQPTGAAGPPAPPGVVRSTQYAFFGVARLLWAWRRRAKTLMTKLQLGLGLLGALALALAWLVALYTALVAAGLDLPEVFGGLFGENAAPWTFGLFGTGAVLSWAAVRKGALAFAATLQHLIDYVRNTDRANSTVCLTVDDAIAGLLDAEWKGKIHLLGYSFGSLVLYDAAFPHPTTGKAAAPLDRAASLVTVGCPLDLVRLYFKDYTAGRQARTRDIPWTNIFNAADVFASNLKDKGDTDGGKSNALELEVVQPQSLRYLRERLTLTQLLMAKGFRTHGGYWGTVDEGHCFERLVDNWHSPVDATSRDSAASGDVPSQRQSKAGGGRP